MTLSKALRLSLLAGLGIWLTAPSGPLRADTLSYTLLGSFDSSAVFVPGLMGPDQFFRISFSLPSQPVVGASGAGYFDVTPASMLYVLGSTPTALDADLVEFDDPLSESGFDITIYATHGSNALTLQIEGSVLFMGAESSPMLSSAFPTITGGAYALEDHQNGGALVDPDLLVADSPTPEPGALALVLAGASALAALRFRGVIRRAARPLD